MNKVEILEIVQALLFTTGLTCLILILVSPLAFSILLLAILFSCLVSLEQKRLVDKEHRALTTYADSVRLRNKAYK